MNSLPTEFTQVYFRADQPKEGWPQQFAIVTAYNPEGQITEATSNIASDLKLRSTLQEMGLSHFRVTGGSRDGKHQEPGWGIALHSPRPAQELCAQFKQLAFFWILNGRLALVDTRSDESTIQAEWSQRWLGSAFWEPSSSTETSKDLVYRRIPHQPELLIFAPRSRAFFVHQIWSAIKLAQTWREFSALLPSGEWSRMLEQLDESPDDSDKFDEELLPGYSDGDYPPWLQAEIGRCLPVAALQNYCQEVDSGINGSFCKIPQTNESHLVATLEHSGYSVERKDDWFFY